jgi:transcriptional regulator with XRE-family HTH domain
MTTFSKRLKQARLQAQLSQERLGLKVGLEPESASTRMNRYELGKRSPALELVERIAAELDLPITYFYAECDEEANLLINFHKLNETKRKQVIKFVEDVSKNLFLQKEN